MGAKSARKYNQHQAERVVRNIETILNRINKKHTPFWMIAELESAQHNAQCIQQEFERIMKGDGEKT